MLRLLYSVQSGFFDTLFYPQEKTVGPVAQCLRDTVQCSDGNLALVCFPMSGCDFLQIQKIILALNVFLTLSGILIAHTALTHNYLLSFHESH